MLQVTRQTALDHLPPSRSAVKCFSLTHLSDSTLLRDLSALVARDRVTTAELLAHIAEVDSRRLYLPAAYPSMYAYCVGELRLSEEAAFKRIHAARVARRCPAVFAYLADGRLHLSAVIMLAPHLTEQTAEELLAGASNKTRSELEHFLAARFPRPDLPTLVQALPMPRSIAGEHAPGRVDLPGPIGIGPVGTQPQTDPGSFENSPQHAPGRADVPAVRPRLVPLAPERYALQLTVGQATHDKLRHAQRLLGHQIPAGDLAQVLDVALDALIARLERRKLAAMSKPSAARESGQAGPRTPRPTKPTRNPRHIPADVRRVVWQSDRGQCTFVSAAGRRCGARTRLEFDHVHEVARGGRGTVAGIRLRCREHNQYAAECTFGVEFMRRKREAAANARASGARAPASTERTC